MQNYTKKTITINEQISLLKEKGLVITDREHAKFIL